MISAWWGSFRFPNVLHTPLDLSELEIFFCVSLQGVRIPKTPQNSPLLLQGVPKRAPTPSLFQNDHRWAWMRLHSQEWPRMDPGATCPRTQVPPPSVPAHEFQHDVTIIESCTRWGPYSTTVPTHLAPTICTTLPESGTGLERVCVWAIPAPPLCLCHVDTGACQCDPQGETKKASEQVINTPKNL